MSEPSGRPVGLGAAGFSLNIWKMVRRRLLQHVSLSSVQVGYDMTRLAATKCFEAAGLRPRDVDVVELHDCFSANELITYEALGLCAEGKKAAGFTTFVSTSSQDGGVSLVRSHYMRNHCQQPQRSLSPGNLLPISVSFKHQFHCLISLQ